MQQSDYLTAKSEPHHQELEIEMPSISQLQNNSLKDLGFNERQGFIVKVYSIISIQLLVTCLFCTLAYISLPFRYAIVSPGGYNLTALSWVCMAVSIITQIAIFCCKDVSRKVPNNYIALTVFTLAFSVVTAGSCSTTYERFSNGPELVLSAAFMTLGATLMLTLYAFTCKTDFTLFGGSLWLCGWTFSACIFSLIFYPTVSLYILVSSASTIIYGLYLIYDTQLIVGGKTHELSIDDYILGAMLIYIDIIILFMRLLQILLIMFGKK